MCLPECANKGGGRVNHLLGVGKRSTACMLWPPWRLTPLRGLQEHEAEQYRRKQP